MAGQMRALSKLTQLVVLARVYQRGGPAALRVQSRTVVCQGKPLTMTQFVMGTMTIAMARRMRTLPKLRPAAVWARVAQLDKSAASRVTFKTVVSQARRLRMTPPVMG